MLNIVKSGALVGLDAREVVIEVDVSRGLPGTTIVGLPDTAVQESRERVRAAISNCDYEFSPRKVTVNLAPADLKKAGPAFDLPIAIGILLSLGRVERDEKRADYWLTGELSLTGEVRPVTGVLSLALEAKKQGAKGILVPLENWAEANIVNDLDVVPVSTLVDAAEFLNGKQPQIFSEPEKQPLRSANGFDIDFADVRGQAHARRAFEIAAAGRHHIIMVGPPGSGKSMMAQRLASIMPETTADEAVEITKIQSVSGISRAENGLVWARPFRAPHHTISEAGLAGGGQKIRPGEITLSHRGVLFLDEIAEFSPKVLQVLRQPLERGDITISRASGAYTYPADFLLVGAMNPCPCGYLGDRSRECHCSIRQIKKYRSRLSGPLLDRFDLHTEITRLGRIELMEETKSESSQAIRMRVLAARRIQADRFQDASLSNGTMTAEMTRQRCQLAAEARAWLFEVVEKLSLSGRGYDRVLRVARTIADLAGAPIIEIAHLAEAIQFRQAELR